MISRWREYDDGYDGISHMVSVTFTDRQVFSWNINEKLADMLYLYATNIAMARLKNEYDENLTAWFSNAGSVEVAEQDGSLHFVVTVLLEKRKSKGDAE